MSVHQIISISHQEKAVNLVTATLQEVTPSNVMLSRASVIASLDMVDAAVMNAKPIIGETRESSVTPVTATRPDH